MAEAFEKWRGALDMNLRTIFPAVALLVVAACGGQNPDSPTTSASDGAALRQAPAPEDLWDTSMTYGFAASDDATGLERGQQVYEQWCAICHSDGPGMAGTDSLKRSYMMLGVDDMSPILTERTDLSPALIELVVRRGIKSMPYFRKTEISDEDLALMGAYLAQNNPDYQEE